jgi:hypothetical protein
MAKHLSRFSFWSLASGFASSVPVKKLIISSHVETVRKICTDNSSNENFLLGGLHGKNSVYCRSPSRRREIDNRFSEALHWHQESGREKIRRDQQTSHFPHEVLIPCATSGNAHPL